MSEVAERVTAPLSLPSAMRAHDGRALTESSGVTEGGAGRSGPPEPSPGSAERVS
ncbi:hypothetical protein [Streptomyces griseosporeus]|uniref:hypothetical protein n=1 Tax=Streptomyces griseosporeus TaxID=1910 RepID=UPI0036CDE5AD